MVTKNKWLLVDLSEGDTSEWGLGSGKSKLLLLRVLSLPGPKGLIGLLEF